MAKKRPDQALVDKWQSYTGTGITANKGENSLALRQAIGGEEFAIVKLHGGCWTTSRLEVLEEIKTDNREVAEKRFQEVSEKLGFERQPVRTFMELFRR